MAHVRILFEASKTCNSHCEQAYLHKTFILGYKEITDEDGKIKQVPIYGPDQERYNECKGTCRALSKTLKELVDERCLFYNTTKKKNPYSSCCEMMDNAHRLAQQIPNEEDY
jgi:hypothetical protein